MEIQFIKEMNNILEFVSCAICLTLDTREKLALNLISNYKKYGVDLKPFVVGDGNILKNYNQINSNDIPPMENFYKNYSLKDRIRAYNCWKSHRQILEYFVNNFKEKDTLLLVEDDGIIIENHIHLVQKTCKFLQNTKCDMLYLGCNNKDLRFNFTKHPNLLKLNYNTGGWHSVIISHKICKLLLTFPPITSFDDICAKFIQPKFDCYAIYPSIVIQQGKSNINEYEYTQDPWELGEYGFPNEQIRKDLLN